MQTQITWQRLDNPTVEKATITTQGGVVISSTITGLYEGAPVDLDYTLVLRSDWSWESLEIVNGVGTSLRLDRSTSQFAEVEFVDLYLTPVTNTLPIRKLGLVIGESGEIETVYFRPETFEPALERQSYTRLAENQYRFSDNNGFTAEILVDDDGWVLEYEGLFKRV